MIFVNIILIVYGWFCRGNIFFDNLIMSSIWEGV